MERLVAAGVAALALAVWLSATACGASAPWGSVAETSAPPPRVGTPSPATAAPTSPATATPPSRTTVAPTSPATQAPSAEPTATPVAVPGGNVEEGRLAIQKYGCGSCHAIPGVPGANGRVGPSLAGFAKLKAVAGVAPNTPQNLIRWLQNPQTVKPGTTMPTLGVTETDARNIAAYLYTLR